MNLPLLDLAHRTGRQAMDLNVKQDLTKVAW